MIYLSAQPDELYFLWQIQVQQQNFKDVGIDISTMYVLIGYEQDKPINNEEEWLKLDCNVLFYAYQKYESYIPLLRPHIIKQFLEDYPHFVDDYIFYHDSDIMFSSLPDFDTMQDGRVHLSDTIDYIGYKYIKSKSVGQYLIDDLCYSVGIDKQLVKKNEKKSGGCHYFLLGTDAYFWNRVEESCLSMIETYQANEAFYKAKWSNRRKEEYDFQIWTTDMWCVLWNLWLFGFETVIDPELSFSWAVDPIDHFHKHKIFHNAGVTDAQVDKCFHKGHYTQTLPYGADLSHVKDTAQFYYVQLIKQVNTKYLT
jgi:hypothetical protein